MAVGRAKEEIERRGEDEVQRERKRRGRKEIKGRERKIGKKEEGRKVDDGRIRKR